MRSRMVLALACAVAWLGVAYTAEKSAASMADAATKFVSSLTPEQRQKAAFAFESEERLKWHFIPTEMFARNGLTVGEMTEAQRKLAHGLLQSGLSQRGYMTATAIMDLETVLNALESAQRQAGRGGESMVRDPVRYFFSVFGTPSPRGGWGWRVEGHHVSLNFTVVNGSFVAASPSFFGSNPAEVREGPKKGTRILATQEDSARALLMALDDGQRKQAVIDAAAPNDISTMNAVDIKPLAPGGIGADKLNATQREDADGRHRFIRVGDGARYRQRTAGSHPQGGRREDHVRVGGRGGARTAALLPRPGADVPDRVRQHPEQREPHSFRVARLPG